MCVFAFEILESLYLFLKYLAVIIYIKCISMHGQHPRCYVYIFLKGWIFQRCLGQETGANGKGADGALLVP